MEVKAIDIENITMFSDRDRDFYLHPEKFDVFTAYPFSFDAFSKVIAARKKTFTNRELLNDVLNAQYQEIDSSSLTRNNIQSLLDEDCFTVTTAHQPSLMTGPLYYIYKILSTINLAEQLSKNSAVHVVPVFVIGGEDHDFEEVNHFYLFNKKIEWDTNQNGSVGEFSCDNLEIVLDQLNDTLGSNHLAKDLLSALKKDVVASKNYGDFAFRLTHRLFDKYGLVILRMNSKELKTAFVPLMEDDLIHNTSKDLVEATQSRLEQIGYKSQAFVRDINLFYTEGNQRNRIEKDGDRYIVVDTDIRFTNESIIKELNVSPQNFSPNVILRPLFQELILPNLAYIGGGGELAYWTERHSQFKHYNIHFPMLIRRTSAMIISESLQKQMDKLGYNVEDLFHPVEKLILDHINSTSTVDYKLEAQKLEIEKIFDGIQQKIRLIDQTLIRTSIAEQAKIHKSLEYLENKLKKSLKQQEEVQIKRIHKLKDNLFPSGLQERHDNIFEYIAQYGTALLDSMLPHCNPFSKKMMVMLLQAEDRPA